MTPCNCKHLPECPYRRRYEFLNFDNDVLSPIIFNQNDVITPAPYITYSNPAILRVNILICLDKKTPNTIPKIGSPFWTNLDNQNLIKKNIEIPNNLSSLEIYNLIFNLFSNHLYGQGWNLFNSSSGTLKKVSSNVNSKTIIIFFKSLNEFNLSHFFFF